MKLEYKVSHAYAYYFIVARIDVFVKHLSGDFGD